MTFPWANQIGRWWCYMAWLLCVFGRHTRPCQVLVDLKPSQCPLFPWTPVFRVSTEALCWLEMACQRSDNTLSILICARMCITVSVKAVSLKWWLQMRVLKSKKLHLLLISWEKDSELNAPWRVRDFVFLLSLEDFFCVRMYLLCKHTKLLFHVCLFVDSLLLLSQNEVRDFTKDIFWVRVVQYCLGAAQIFYMERLKGALESSLIEHFEIMLCHYSGEEILLVLLLLMMHRGRVQTLKC